MERWHKGHLPGHRQSFAFIQIKTSFYKHISGHQLHQTNTGLSGQV